MTRVGDADNFHLFHTPGGRLTGWGWLPGRKVPEKKADLKGKTVFLRSIRVGNFIYTDFMSRYTSVLQESTHQKVHISANRRNPSP